MKTFVCAGAAVLALGCGSALAADLSMPYKAAPPPIAYFSWTGCYIGAHGGGAWGSKDYGGFGFLPNTVDISGGFAGGRWCRRGGDLVGELAAGAG